MKIGVEGIGGGTLKQSGKLQKFWHFLGTRGFLGEKDFIERMGESK